MNRRYIMMLTLIVAVLLLFTACAPGTARFTGETAGREAGFLWGIWHGWIAPVSLIWQLFNSAIRVYETHNTGFWYDLGFYLAIVGGFGGLSLTRKKARKHD
jgi:hypothetical protein